MPARRTDRERVILHSDMNCFYASVECARRPEIRQLPVVVGGHEEARHGIVLTKNQLAKGFGIKTGEALWEARKKCPGLVVIPPDYRLYQQYSRLARQIYYDYSPCVEPFGLDEAWIDLSGSLHLFGGDVDLVCREISERIKAELGLTVSIGASWNKIFAKFGSDYKKPDAITHVTRDNYRQLVWGAPVQDLLYVGRATQVKLNASAIYTIGDLALAPPRLLSNKLGKIGAVLQGFACGEDVTPVKEYDPANNTVDYPVKSVGNGLTAPHDLLDAHDTRALLFLLCESVGQRLRELQMQAGCIGISVRDSKLSWYSRQVGLGRPTNITGEISRVAYQLLQRNEPLDGSHPLRSLGVRASNLTAAGLPEQLNIFDDEEARCRAQRLDAAVDALRRRFGNNCVRRAATILDGSMADLDIKGENTVHPVGYFQDGVEKAISGWRIGR